MIILIKLIIVINNTNNCQFKDWFRSRRRFPNTEKKSLKKRNQSCLGNYSLCLVPIMDVSRHTTYKDNNDYAQLSQGSSTTCRIWSIPSPDISREFCSYDWRCNVWQSSAGFMIPPTRVSILTWTLKRNRLCIGKYISL